MRLRSATRRPALRVPEAAPPTATWCVAAPLARPACTHHNPPSAAAPRARQVKEGHDSTVRPKMLVFEFDGGRKYLDEWAADGKPGLTRAQMRRVQSWKIFFGVVVPPILLLIDYGEGETFATPFKRRVESWWRGFCALDSADVAKAYAGGWRPRRD